MIATDEAALRCDFAETYRILDYRELPARRAALFACGLPAGSRIMRKLSGAELTPEQLLLAIIADALRILIWQNTEDGHAGRNLPVSILDTMRRGGETPEGVGFDTPEEFNAWRDSLMQGGE